MYTNYHIDFTGITGLPDETTWTQVYHAGNLSVLIVLQEKKPDEEDRTKLAKKGQHILHSLEAEFFSLQTKTLSTIKKIIEELIEDNKDLLSSCAISVTSEHMYIYTYGQASILLSRGGHAGKIMGPSEELVALEGKREPGDQLLLVTQALLEAIPAKDLLEGLTLSPDEFHETYMARIHEAQDPHLACARIDVLPEPEEENAFEQTPDETSEETPEIDEPIQEAKQAPEEKEEEETPPAPPIKLSEATERRRERSESFGQRFPHRKRLLWTITLLIAITFIVSIILYMRNSQERKIHDLFQTSVIPLEKTITDAQAIESINPTQAQQQLSDAKGQLEKLLPQFPTNSSEYKQIQDLLNKLQSGAQNATTLPLASSPSPLLQAWIAHPDTTAGFEDTKDFYLANTTNVTRTQKSTSTSDTMLSNKSYWDSAKSVVIYSGNIYLLSTQDVLKFVPSGSGYSKSSYFAQTTDVSQATSIAVDQNMWVGMHDGSIAKYNRGKIQTFTLSSSMGKPQTISYLFTTPDSDSLFAIDTTQSLLYVINKSGSVTKTIPVAPGIQAATLLPDASAIQVVIGGKIYQVALQ